MMLATAVRAGAGQQSACDESRFGVAPSMMARRAKASRA